MRSLLHVQPARASVQLWSQGTAHCCFRPRQVANGGEAAKAEVQELATKAAIGGAIVTACVVFSKNIQVTCIRNRFGAGGGAAMSVPNARECSPALQAVVAPIGPAYLSSAGGPFTIHPWPPVTKLMISARRAPATRPRTPRAARVPFIRRVLLTAP